MGPLLTLLGGSAACSVLTPKLFSLTRPPYTKGKKFYISLHHITVSVRAVLIKSREKNCTEIITQPN